MDMLHLWLLQVIQIKLLQVNYFYSSTLPDIRDNLENILVQYILFKQNIDNTIPILA